MVYLSEDIKLGKKGVIILQPLLMNACVTFTQLTKKMMLVLMDK